MNDLAYEAFQESMKRDHDKPVRFGFTGGEMTRHRVQSKHMTYSDAVQAGDEIDVSGSYPALRGALVFEVLSNRVD
jgi:hypothetical protein